MSRAELTRVEVLARVQAGTLSLKTAADMVDVSYRQIKRLWRRYREGGAASLQHRGVGQSNRAAPAAVRMRALALVRAKYSGAPEERFGPTLAAEHLASEDGVAVPRETLRRWMLTDGLWSKARKRRPYRQRRARRAHAGELLQLDGSFHPWFEDRSPSSPCLITLVDDATSRSLGRFSEQETIWAAAAVLRAWIETYGIPQALYTDWKNVYLRTATDLERAEGVTPVTQFGRMCEALGIRIIGANSPQAKGRIERNHGTHQDRLVKKLRRLGIQDLPAANAYLTATYWSEHNQRFARPPASAEDVHRRCPTLGQLDAVFHLREDRTVGDDWVVRYHNRFLQLERQSGYAPARSTVTVGEWPDGRLEVTYRGFRMRWHETTASRPLVPGAPRVAPPTPRSRPRRPFTHDHPWKREEGDEGNRKVELWHVLDR